MVSPLRCASCGADLVDEARFCHRCGRAAGVVEVIDLTRDDWGRGSVDASPVARERPGAGGPPRWLVAVGAVAAVALLGWLVAGSGGDDEAAAKPTPEVAPTASAVPTEAPSPTVVGAGSDAEPGRELRLQADTDAAWRWTGPPDLGGVRPVGLTAGSDGLRLFGWVAQEGELGLHVWRAAAVGADWEREVSGPVLRSDLEVTEVVATSRGYLALARPRQLDALWWSPNGLDWEPRALPVDGLWNAVVSEVGGRVVLVGVDSSGGLPGLLPEPVVDLVSQGGGYEVRDDEVVARGAFGLLIAAYSWDELGLAGPPGAVVRSGVWSRPLGGGAWREADAERSPIGTEHALITPDGRLVLSGYPGAFSTSDGLNWRLEGGSPMAVIGWDGEPLRLEGMSAGPMGWRLSRGEGDPVDLGGVLPQRGTVASFATTSDAAAIATHVPNPPSSADARTRATLLAADGGKLVWDPDEGLIAVAGSGERWHAAGDAAATIATRTGLVTFVAPSTGVAAFTVPYDSIVELQDEIGGRATWSVHVAASADGLSWATRTLDDHVAGLGALPTVQVVAVGEDVVIAYETLDGATRTISGTPID